MNIRFIVVVLGVIFAGCESESLPIPACFVCSDLMPNARICSSQLGRLEFDGDRYTCNLYFGSSQLCESANYCCRKVGLVANTSEQCVDPDTLTEESEDGVEL